MAKGIQLDQSAKSEVSQAPAKKVPLKRTGRLVTRHLEIRLVNRHAQAWRDLYDGLYENHAMLQDGKAVEHPNDAIRWMLENLEAMQINK